MFVPVFVRCDCGSRVGLWELFRFPLEKKLGLEKLAGQTEREMVKSNVAYKHQI